MTKPLEPHDYTWNEHWRNFLCDEDGFPDFDKIKKELHDYKFVLDTVSETYAEITNGKITSPKCDPKFVIEYVEERLDEAHGLGYDQAIKDFDVKMFRK